MTKGFSAEELKESLKSLGSEEVNSAVSGLTDEDLDRASGGAFFPDGSPSPSNITCRQCGSKNILLAVYTAICFDCGYCWYPSLKELKR